VVTEDVPRWVLSVAFAVAVGYYLSRMVTHRRSGVRRPVLDEGLHALMGVAMIAMLWSWGSGVPIMAYVLVFTAATLWFVAEALFAARSPVTGRSGPALCAGPAGNAWYHALMMGSMVWMAVLLSAASAGATGGGASDGMSAMPGMGIGMGMAEAGAAAGPVFPVPLWSRASSLALAAVFCAAALLLVGRALRPALSRRRTSASPPAVQLVGGLMAAAMTAAFVEMA
jgi:Domain of unknown function (DUF5134)